MLEYETMESALNRGSVIITRDNFDTIKTTMNKDKQALFQKQSDIADI